MRNEKEFVGIGEAAKFLEISANTLRNNEVLAKDGNRFLVKGDYKIRVYQTIGGQRRYRIVDLKTFKYL